MSEYYSKVDDPISLKATKCCTSSFGCIGHSFCALISIPFCCCLPCDLYLMKQEGIYGIDDRPSPFNCMGDFSRLLAESVHNCCFCCCVLCEKNSTNK